MIEERSERSPAAAFTGVVLMLVAFSILSIGRPIVIGATTRSNGPDSKPAMATTGSVRTGRESLNGGNRDSRGDQAPKGQSAPTSGQIRAAISAGFSPSLNISPGDKDGTLRYFIGDYNGDGFPDIAVAVSSDGSPDFKLVDGVRISSPKSRSQSPIDLKQRVEGIAVIHGGPGGWEAGAALPRFLLVWVGYPSKLAMLHGSTRLKYPLPPLAKGDALLCMGEGSGDGYVYFDGGAYRFKLVTRGD